MNNKNKIIDLIKKHKEVDRGLIKKELGNTISDTHISRILKGLSEDALILKFGHGRYTKYILKENIDSIKNKFNKRLHNENLEEHLVLDEIKKKFPYVSNLPEDIQSIFDYAFSEMFNNAIDHSESKNIEINLENIEDDFQFIINDFGIGVFRNVKNKRGLESEFEAMQDLMKGKTTTAPQAHSGEGIFFTSKTADEFILESFGFRLRVDNIKNDVFFEEYETKDRGTRVIFKLSKKSNRHLSDIFEKYQSDDSYAFDKTIINVKLYTLGTIHVSRSQARRILFGLEKFKTIILDFDKVPSVGQAFTDEIFRVFNNKHKDIKIETINTNSAVQFMIDRAINTER